MSASIDLILLPLIRRGEQIQTEFPGLHVATPPRRPARHRRGEQLILYLNLAGNAPLAPEYQDQLLSGLAEAYYKTSGSVTAAQRKLAETLNEYLLERNLRNASTGHQAIGLLTQVVLTGNRLAIAHSGPTHAFLIISGDSQDLYDPQLGGRGLGLSRTTAIRFNQANLRPNEALLLTPDPPVEWTPAALQSIYNQGPENLRYRLLTQGNRDLNAVLLQAEVGKGQVRVLRPVRSDAPPPVQAKPPRSGPVSPSQAQERTSASERSPERPQPDPAQARPPIEERQRAEAPQTSAVSPAGAAQPPSGTRRPVASSVSAPVDASPSPPRRAAPRLPSIDVTPLKSVFGAIGSAFGKTFAEIGRVTGGLLRQTLPDEGLFTLPASTMAFVAIAIPLLVVTVATLVYFQRGRAAQYEIYFTQAMQAAAQAEAQTEPDAQREAWSGALAILEQAEDYQTTAESEALRAHARSILDSLDYVERVNYQPALNRELDETVDISRMITSNNDLYMLNATDGVVLRAAFTSSGYALDPAFQCGPGPYGAYIVGALVDIAPLPSNNDLDAALLAIDGNGNLLYCIPEDAPLAVQMRPPDTNWGTPLGVAQNNGDLFILDPQVNAVWIFRGREVSEEPRLFFGEQVPPMADVLDMAVNNNDLYLLHADGHMTTCVFSALIESPTRCEDPAVYSDARPGRQDGTVIEDANFDEILFSPPPDPSLYLLEAETQAIYHFSVRLTFQRQYRPQDRIAEEPATAFSLDRDNHTLFLAVGNQVYFGGLP